MNARLLVLLSWLFGAPMFGQGTAPPGRPQVASFSAFGDGDCDEKGLLESVGIGTPGTNGIPQLGIFGAPLQGLPFSFEVTGALPNAHGCFGFGVNETRSLKTYWCRHQTAWRNSKAIAAANTVLESAISGASVSRGKMPMPWMWRSRIIIRGDIC